MSAAEKEARLQRMKAGAQKHEVGVGQGCGPPMPERNASQVLQKDRLDSAKERDEREGARIVMNCGHSMTIMQCHSTHAHTHTHTQNGAKRFTRQL